MASLNSDQKRDAYNAGYIYGYVRPNPQYASPAPDDSPAYWRNQGIKDALAGSPVRTGTPLGWNDGWQYQTVIPRAGGAKNKQSADSSQQQQQQQQQQQAQPPTVRQAPAYVPATQQSNAQVLGNTGGQPYVQPPTPGSGGGSGYMPRAGSPYPSPTDPAYSPQQYPPMPSPYPWPGMPGSFGGSGLAFYGPGFFFSLPFPSP